MFTTVLLACFYFCWSALVVNHMLNAGALFKQERKLVIGLLFLAPIANVRRVGDAS